MIVGYYKNYLYTTDISSALKKKKKKKKKKSPSIWFRTPKPVRIRQSGRTGLGGVIERVLPLGSIQLVLTLGDPPCQATTTVRFLIVDAPSAYNMLLGRPSLNAIRAITSAYHMVIKFPIANGVGMVRGNQRVAKECYSASMK